LTELLGIVQFLLISLICVYEGKKKSPIIFLWATLFIMFGVMHLIESFSETDNFSQIVLCKASVFVIIFCLVYILFRVCVTLTRKEYSRLDYFKLIARINGSNEMKISYAIFYIFLLAIIVKLGAYIYSVGGILNTSWANVRAYSTGLSYGNYEQILNIIYYSFAGIGLYFLLSKKYFSGAVSIVACIVLVLITRQRVGVLPAIIVIMALYIFKLRHLSMKTIITVMVASIAVIYVIYGLRVFRHYGTLNSFFQDFNLNEFINNVNLQIATGNGELGLKKYFYYFIQNNNEFENFGEGHTYLRMFLIFIPTRWSFGIKPTDFALSMGAAVGMASGGSMHPTLFGDCYANLGWIGAFVLAIFWVMYARIADKIILSRASILEMNLLYVLYAVTYVFIGRGAVYNGFFFAAYGTVFILILSWLMRHIKWHKKYISR